MQVKFTIEKKLLKIIILLFTILSNFSYADEQITTDNRVKTYVYN